MSREEQPEEVIPTVCASHCGGNCLLRLHVKDGVILRIESDDDGKPPFRACLRGRAYRQRVYHPDRLKFPLKRVGAKGEGKFERMSWDEAYDAAAKEIKRIYESYGPESVMMLVSAGDITALHGSMGFYALLNLLGGYSHCWGTFSFEGGLFAEYTTYGTTYTRNTRDDLLHSRLVLMWGWNPAETILDTPTTWVLGRAKEAGVKLICIDPRFTNTAAVLADEWVPIRPGTDAAMLIAMAYVMINENLQDQAFLDKYTVGFERYKEYVLGAEDGVAKTPAWAESISGVPASTIARLARAYATEKPAALIAGISPGRTAYGEQYHRAAIALAAMTGNVGIHGGDAAGRSYAALGSFPFLQVWMSMIDRQVPNPLLMNLPHRKYAPEAYYRDPLWGYGTAPGHVNRFEAADAILKGKAGGYPADYKMLLMVNTNLVNQYGNTNKWVEALRSLDFVLILEQLMTPTAKFADIILPTNTFMERNDMTFGEGIPMYGFQNKAIEPIGESKSHLEIVSELAKRLGINDFNKTEDEILRAGAANTPIPNFEEFKKKGIHLLNLPEPYVAFKDEIQDPEKKPFPTPSGKIEIFSQEIADWNHPKIPPIPKYLETWESRNDPLAKKYPLQLTTSHFWRRAHSTFDNVPWLRELGPQHVLISTVDAETRGINDGDQVMAFNDRGKTMVIAEVTEGIMPGVVDIPEGAWYDPDENGVDRGGCCNVLTKDARSPGGAFCTSTTLVEIKKV